MGILIHFWNTVLSTILTIGYIPFAVLVIVNIILYRIHPVVGFLGTLFLFVILMGYIR